MNNILPRLLIVVAVAFTPALSFQVYTDTDPGHAGPLLMLACCALAL
ncbi:MAG: hypothetical protein QOG73_95, partial [Acetobacteraceae bacterium]|nr:hypothetical protein [Acetobacteraceae bacterium]